MRKWYIYGIFRKSEPDNIIYIGQHTYTNPNDSYMGSGKKLLELYKNEGKENFGKIIFEKEILKRETVSDLEREYINKFRKINKDLLNINNGGGSSVSVILEDGQTYSEYRKKQQKEYREKTKEHQKERHKKYYEENIEKIKKYREKNKENKKNYDKKYYKENIKRIKEYREKNKEIMSKKRKEYNEKNREMLLKKHREYNEKNRETKVLRLKALRRIQKDKELFEKYKILSFKEKTIFLDNFILNNNLKIKK
jgi:hypothetical protein